MLNSLVACETRKTRRGWIGTRQKEIYFHQSVSCGLHFCPEHCRYPSGCLPFDLDLNQNQIIYLLDDAIVLSHTDIIIGCKIIDYMIILQTSLIKLKQKYLPKYARNQHKFTSLQTFLSAANNKAYVFPDLYLKASRDPHGGHIKNSEVVEVYRWLRDHWSQIGARTRIVLLHSQYIADQGKMEKVFLPTLLKQADSVFLDYLGFGIKNESLLNVPIFSRTSIYQEHYPLQIASDMLKRGVCIQAKILGAKSYLKLPNNLTVPVHIQSNRQIYGDLVAVELLPPSQWLQKPRVVPTQGEQNIPVETQLSVNTDLGAFTPETLQLLSESSQGGRLMPVGKVKSIIKRNSRPYCGTIQDNPVYQHQTESWSIYRFFPLDQKMPNFYIRTFNGEKLAKKRIVVELESWPANSQYPLCHYLRTLGDVDDPTVEGTAILLEHGVELNDFSRSAYECLPKDLKIPSKQFQRRLDLRAVDIVSVDPIGCKDIDDALHCCRLPNGNYQVGVHIADVSHYVRPDTALDLEARNRCTTVYLVDRRTDMLPKLLTEDLCSLKSRVDRLAFSVIWELTPEAQIVNTQYGKAVIHSRHSFSYEEAQSLIDSSQQSPIAKSLRDLNALAKKLKRERKQKGALELASTQVKVRKQLDR